MPLKKGKSDKVVSGNISEIVKDYEKSGNIGKSKPASKGKAVKQAVAIALSTAGKPKMKQGGVVRTVKKRDGNKPVKIY
jgi:hypothetical protein